MNAPIILVLLLYWSPTSSSFPEETTWTNYKLIHHKTYADSREETRRFRSFLDNLKAVQTNNQLFERGHVPYKLGINKFSDVSQEEFSASIKANAKKWNLKIEDRNFDRVEAEEDDGGVPDAMDWREKGAVTDVKDETYCYNGYSWAFSVIGAVETQHFLSNDTLENLSVQQLIDCADPSDNFGECYQNFAFDYLKKHAIATEEQYPNTCTEGSCRELGEVHVTEAVDMSSEYSIRIDCALTGPVTVYMDASRLQSYRGGIVDGSLCGNGREDLNHSVLVVGYGEDDGKKYWILKNSWGVDWGEGGYLRTERWANNTCGIAWSAAAAMETRHFLSNGTLEWLSAQQLIDCADPAENVDPWYQNFAFAYLKQNPLALEEDYPYTCTVDACKNPNNDTKTPVTSAKDLVGEQSIKNHCGLNGTVSVYIDASRISQYQSGVIDGTLCDNGREDLNHAALVVGYGQEEGGRKYWILKNSWGVNWGEDGYFRVARGVNNTCGIAWSPVIPTK